MDRGDAGGIGRVAALLAEHGGAIEADLQRYYGVHVGDFPWPLTARRVAVLVRELPEGSAYHRSVVGAAEAGWGVDAHLLARVVDELRALQFQVAVVSGVKGLAPPKPIPRPGVQPEGKPRPDPAAVRALLAARGVRVPDELSSGEAVGGG